MAPAEVLVALGAGEAAEAAALARATLPAGTEVSILPADGLSPDGLAGAWSTAARLADGCRGSAIAVLTESERWAPGFLAAVHARFRARDQAGIAAVAVEADPACVGPHDLELEAVLQDAAPRCHAFVYRRDALEQVGGWDIAPMGAARWDLHLRLLMEWRIALLPAPLATRQAGPPGIAAAEQAAYRSTQQRRLLRQAPSQLGLLLTIAQGQAAARQREAALEARIATLSAQVEVLAALARAGRVPEGRGLLDWLRTSLRSATRWA
ncbi:hypothetical protein [Falsiroseomonas selenitidurans]|uniref:Uncharacterized protein n=1 Tax=Falsiroseomonas selenitidurans TaxID=2716335 RepID=A0ABX1E8W1_9PROT|nr:hypothetical protein [Falsiroseomonas selenitidurans]NKC33393.1 hypothetical protein [Falsiroseomonas selenitidurans]